MTASTPWAGLAGITRLARRRPRSAVWIALLAVATVATWITATWWWLIAAGALLVASVARFTRDVSPLADWKRWKIIDVSDWRLRLLSWKVLWGWHRVSTRLGLAFVPKRLTGASRPVHAKVKAIREDPTGLAIVLKLPPGSDSKVFLGAGGQLSTQLDYEVLVSKLGPSDVVVQVITRDPLVGDRTAVFAAPAPERQDHRS